MATSNGTAPKKTTRKRSTGVDPALLAPDKRGARGARGKVREFTLDDLYSKTMGEVRARIRGMAPLLYHPMTKKAQVAMEDKVQGKSKVGRSPRDFDEDFLGCLREMALKGAGPKTMAEVRKFEYGIKALCFKNALVDAGKMFSKNKTDMRRMVFVPGVNVAGSCMVKIEGTPELDTRPARNVSGSFDIRARPIFHEWEADLVVRYQSRFVDAQSVLDWIKTCGECCGVGDFRPNGHASTGDLGTWNVLAASCTEPEKE